MYANDPARLLQGSANSAYAGRIALELQIILRTNLAAKILFILSISNEDEDGSASN